jgi:hypothetical protein
MTQCNLCGESIHFDKDIVSERTGKKIPLQDGSDERHRCEAWLAQNRKDYHCHNCDDEIYFDDDHISKNGKHVPVDKQTREPHQCKVKAV